MSQFSHTFIYVTPQGREEVSELPKAKTQEEAHAGVREFLQKEPGTKYLLGSLKLVVNRTWPVKDPTLGTSLIAKKADAA